MMSSTRQRIKATALLLAAVFCVLFGRAAQLTLLEGDELRKLALRQHQTRVPLPPRRGPIVDRNGEPLALTTESAAVYLRPKDLKASPEVLGLVARLLGLSPQVVMAKAASDSPFVWLDRRVPLERWEAVEELGVPGIGSEASRQRLYPKGRLAAQVLGFTNIDGQGMEGVERMLDADLRGVAEALEVERDARGRRADVDGRWRPLSRVGAQVELTIDAPLQEFVEQELEAAVEQWGAKAGTVVVLAPESGEVLAMASVPTYDPNLYGKSTADQRRNRAITDTYEPGSTFKAITAAAVLDAGVVRPTDMIFCERGNYPVGRRVIHDVHPQGLLTFAQVIEKSSNIGSAKVAERLGRERFGEAIRAFGFGRPTGLGLQGEVSGIVRPPEQWGRIDLVTNAFGQGIAVTPIQLTRAFAAIASGGLLMRPRVVRRVTLADGTVKYEGRPEVVGRVMSEETAAALRTILQGVVDHGTGTAAKIEGFAVAGKTGTAQKVDPKTGRYHPRDRISSFVGFVPANDPKLAILVVIDTPRKAVYGGTVAAPSFKRIAEFGLERRGVRPWSIPLPEPSEFEKDPPIQLMASFSDMNGPENGVPSFLGLSMRDALVRAHQFGLSPRIKGEGYVVAQDPPAGAPIGSEVSLEFRADVS